MISISSAIIIYAGYAILTNVYQYFAIKSTKHTAYITGYNDARIDIADELDKHVDATQEDWCLHLLRVFDLGF
jgi:hypothetical protein